MNHPFMKWPGSKRKSVAFILEHLPQGKRLFEPFAGSAVISLATDFEEYYLGDVNADLMTLYRWVEQDADGLIEEARLRFEALNPKDPEGYYKLRENYNNTTDPFLRAVMLLTLNRYGYNGLCRYNQKGGYNVPHGLYSKVYFPEREIRAAGEHFRGRLHVDIRSFEEQLSNVEVGDVVYCDPPYVPISNTADFTEYAKGGFDLGKHKLLANIASELRLKGIPVLISNADVEVAREVYKDATQVLEVMVPRSIGARKDSRKKIGELLFIY